jgi:hypothetical protein
VLVELHSARFDQRGGWIGASFSRSAWSIVDADAEEVDETGLPQERRARLEQRLPQHDQLALVARAERLHFARRLPREPSLCPF